MPQVVFLPHSSNQFGAGVIAQNLTLTTTAVTANFSYTMGSHISEDGIVRNGVATVLNVNGQALTLDNDSGYTITGNY
ncbi:hypothetical protein [Edaphovirga cremea]|uniref:hypothetical protein n=1 Tax=Edaphovirga cremea TaxID=2267246 RepID=UPI000DEEE3A4|nr:hypothetical protein [Edaphovirga cremea]